MDANADDMPSYDFVLALERIMDVEASWIHNSFKRPTNRIVTTHVCTSSDIGEVESFKVGDQFCLNHGQKKWNVLRFSDLASLQRLRSLLL